MDAKRIIFGILGISFGTGCIVSTIYNIKKTVEAKDIERSHDVINRRALEKELKRRKEGV